jgi:hypothetical protein
MSIARIKGNKKREVLNAMGHVAWILIISICITVLVNELFRGSNLGRIITLIVIFAYIVFSFVRKFWVEKKLKNILDAIDVTLTLVGGFLLMIIYRAASENDYSTGYALARTIFSNIQTEPHIMIFCLGVLLLVVGAIRMVIINRAGIKYKAPL